MSASSPPPPPRLVISYGLGADSTAVLVRYLLEPDSRPELVRDDFAQRTVVVTAMTGDEWQRSGELVTRHVLPLLREHEIRFVQLARATASQTDGVRVLSDTRRPTRVFLDGAYRLSDELTAAGTVPQAGGARLCSVKSKGTPIDTFLKNAAPAPYLHVIGFERNEERRAARDTNYNTALRTGVYPLIDWGWDRERCQAYLRDALGVPEWPKSACVQCPFALTNQRGRWTTLERMAAHPDEALRALELEFRAVCLNPKQGLIAGERLLDLVHARGGDLHRAWLEHLTTLEFCLYEIRRLFRPRKDDRSRVANASRDLRILARGGRDEMHAALERHADARDTSLEAHDGIARLHLRRRDLTSLPTAEHFLVAAPAGAIEKQRPGFEDWWQELAAHPEAQLRLA